jgi:hypothetical protein
MARKSETDRGCCTGEREEPEGYIETDSDRRSAFSVPWEQDGHGAPIRKRHQYTSNPSTTMSVPPEAGFFRPVTLIVTVCVPAPRPVAVNTGA